MSIFVSIASYRDSQLVPTIKSLIDNADNPNDLHFGIVEQERRGKWVDLSFVKNVKHKKVEHKHAKGAGYARMLATELYSGEDFFFQTDSHMRFAPGWDTKYRNMYDWSREDAGTDKVILSQFPAPFMVLTDGSDYILEDDPDFWDMPSWTSVVQTYYGAWAGNREKIEDYSVPHKSHTVLGAMIFGPGSLALDVPYDPRISFMGEELCYAIRAYTRGYEIYAPNEMLAWHFYKRNNHPKIWGDMKQQWYKIEKNSKDVQRDVLLGIETGVYGISDSNRYEQYQEMIGWDFHEFYSVEREPIIDTDIIEEEITIEFLQGDNNG